MGKLTDSQKSFDVAQFFDPDAPSGEPVLQQIQDPITHEVYGPGLKVTQDGRVIQLAGLESEPGSSEPA